MTTNKLTEYKPEQMTLCDFYKKIAWERKQEVCRLLIRNGMLRDAARLAIANCQQVLDTWDTGDLAGAVRALADTRDNLRNALQP